MKYEVLGSGRLAIDSLPAKCPYDVEHNYCGSICPLFELTQKGVFTPGIAEPTSYIKIAKLHCGAGTREIELE